MFHKNIQRASLTLFCQNFAFTQWLLFYNSCVLITFGKKRLTSLKKRLDYILNQPEKTSGQNADNIKLQLAIIKDAFKESQHYPICCVLHDNQGKISCDTQGPLDLADFMIKCRQCQKQIKQALQTLKINM